MPVDDIDSMIAANTGALGLGDRELDIGISLSNDTLSRIVVFWLARRLK